jgi:phosphoglycerate dehydrogenase-like enzyme
MEARPSPRITVQPRSSGWIDAAVTGGGGVLSEPADATALVWTHNDAPAEIEAFLVDHPHLEWVQLPWAGVDPYRALFTSPRLRSDLVWSCAKGVYADPVAEHALALLLAGFRHLGEYARATSWGREVGRNLFGARITILGGGGIGRVLVDLLAPFRCEVTVVRRTPSAMDGVARVLGADQLDDALRGAEALVLALPLLDETRGLIGARELGLLEPGAWLVNVARGAHVDTDALVAALDSGALGGAGLDVTDPEPLPDGHPLWTRPNVIITPHTGNTREMAKPLLGGRIRENVARYAAGEPLVGLVDPALGY